MSGKGQFPFLVDPNTGKQMLESDAIISYLFNEYGDGQVSSHSALCHQQSSRYFQQAIYRGPTACAAFAHQALFPSLRPLTQPCAEGPAVALTEVPACSQAPSS